MISMGEECGHYEALMAGLLDGTLVQTDRVELEDHIAGCDACRFVIETLQPIAQARGDRPTLAPVDPAGYAVGLEIARGGMGRIIAARDLRVGRPVAIKELLDKSPALATRFEREARVTARLQHPGIVPIYEIGCWPDGTPFYSMRMVDGTTLRQAITSAPTLADRLALIPSLIAAAEAIAFAHAQRIIHRDLTPSNILVGAYGETVVIDWGLAKDLADATTEAEIEEGSAAPGLTHKGAIVGTTTYMPPEQARGEQVDERADVYAIGAILYHVLAGQLPYPAEAGADAVRAGPPIAIDVAAPTAPRDLVSIVAKAMAREPGARYPSALELVAELKRFTTGRMVEAHAYTRYERLRRFARRHRGALIVSVVAAAIVLGGGAFGLRRVLTSRREANDTVTRLLEEKGRTEMLGGHHVLAFAYLAEAFERGDRSPALQFMLDGALRDIEDTREPLDCGSEVRFGDLAPGDLSADGQYVAAPCGDVGKLWRLADRKLLLTLGPQHAAFDQVRFSHDGNTLVALGLDGTARLYDAHTGELRHALVHSVGTRITHVSFTPDDRRLVTTGFDGKAVIWDAVRGTREREIVAGAFGFLGVHGLLARDGNTLLTATLGGVGTAWNIDTGQRLGGIDHGSQMLGGDASPDGRLAATCGGDHRARVWDLATGHELLVVSGHTDVVWKCIFSPDSRRLLTTSSDGTAKVWDVASGALVTSVTCGGLVWSAAFSPDGQLMTTSSLDGASMVWTVDGGALLASHDSAGKAASFSRDGTSLIIQRGDGKIEIANRAAGRLAHHLVPPPGSDIRAVSPDGTRAVIARGFALELWDTTTRAPIRHGAISEPFAFSPDGRRFAARNVDGVVLIDALEGTTIAQLPISDVTSLSLASDGHTLLVQGASGPRVWNVDSRAPVASFVNATAAIIDDDGTLALAWRAGEAPVVWQLGSSAAVPISVLVGVDRGFRPLGFSRDGRRVALHVDEGERHLVRIWDAQSGQQVFAIDEVNDSARFDPHKQRISAIARGDVVTLYDLTTGAPLSSFLGEQLSHAQVDETGKLVVALDKLGEAVLVLDASDGRVLARWAIVHPPLETNESTVVLPSGDVWWTPDGRQLVARSGDITVWDGRLGLDAGAVARVQRMLPWQVVDGRLERVLSTVRGTVVFHDAPASGVQVTMTIREVPRHSSSVSWNTEMSQVRELTTTTDADGQFELTGVLPGDYTLVARRGSLVSSFIAGSTLDTRAAPISLELHR